MPGDLAGFAAATWLRGIRLVQGPTIHGIQFHPESVLTPQGKEIIKNFLNNR